MLECWCFLLVLLDRHIDELKQIKIYREEAGQRHEKEREMAVVLDSAVGGGSHFGGLMIARGDVCTHELLQVFVIPINNIESQ